MNAQPPAADCIKSLKSFLSRELENRRVYASTRPVGMASVEEVKHQLRMVETLEKTVMEDSI